MASNGQEKEVSFLKRGRSVKKGKELKVRQRGFGIAKLELLRLQNEKEVAANATTGSVVPSNLQHEDLRVQAPSYLTPVPPFFSYAPLTVSPLSGPQGVMGDLSSFQMPRDSSSYKSHCPQGTNLPSEEARLDHNDLEFRQPHYFTNLLLAEDSEEEKEQENKKARINPSDARSLAVAGTSSTQEPNLELRLSI